MSSQSIQSQSNAANTHSFLTALWLNGIVFAIEIIVFSVVRGKFKAIYEPRTYIPAEGKRSQSLPTGIFSWPVAVFKADYNQVKAQNGMDAYVFLRFLRMMIKIFLPIWLVSWAILLPVDAIKSSVHSTGLGMFTLGNIGRDQNKRYAAHLILAWLFNFYILWTLQSEMRHFIETRQRYLVSPAHAATSQANTVLITGVPLRYLSESALTRLFEHLPGGVAKVWINHDLKDMPKLYDERLKACNKLESAELSLLRTAGKLKRKGGAKSVAENDGHVEGGSQQNLAASLVPRNKRPTHRIKPGFLPFGLPFIGKKVDSIDWAQEEIVRTNTELNKMRQELENEDSSKVTEKNATTKHLSYPPLNSAFILFNTQIAAHIAAQCLAHHAPYRMSAKYTEVAPADVIWANLNMNPYEIRIRKAISYALTGVLIIFWAVPVAAVGGISAAVSNCTVKGLTWLCDLPGTVVGLISGILPPVLLAVLNLLLPIILRLFARFEGIPRTTGLELSLMTRFFIFQVIHNFLIITISASLFQTLQQLLKNPGQITSLLANGLPKGSTFFLTYMILQGLAGSAAGFLQMVPLIVYYAKLFILGSTPRSIYSIKYDLRDVAWGTLFPSVTLITVISLAYMIISPIITGLATVTFFLFYMMWKYLFLWQLDQPASGDTGGLFFPKALQHTMVGLYLQQICLAILFLLGKGFVEGALMIVLIVITIFFHIIFNNSFSPLIHSLPLTFANRSYGIQADDDLSIAEDEGFGGDANNEKQGGASNGDGVRRRHEPTKLTADDKEKQADMDEAVMNRPPAQSVNVGTTGQAANAYGPSVPTEGKRNDGPTDFNHPAAVEPQRIIWIPNDEYGLAESEIAQLNAAGVEASSENAVIDVKGHTEIDGHPPGMSDNEFY